MISKNFDTDGMASTLSPSVIGVNGSGWTIEGDIHEDYYKWVNEFKAVHPKLGKVSGNFESTVYADSEEGYKHFINNHPPERWDYQDI